MRLLAVAFALLFASAATAATRIDLSIARIEGAALPAALSGVHLSCELDGNIDALQCREGQAAVAGSVIGAVAADFSAGIDQAGKWSVSAHALADHVDLATVNQWLLRAQPSLKSQWSGRGQLEARLERKRDGAFNSTYAAHFSTMTFGEAGGRYATDKIDLASSGSLAIRNRKAALELSLTSAAGQAYAEPVFVDFASAPLTAAVQLKFEITEANALPSAIQALRIEASQSGVFDRFLVQGALSGLPAAAAFSGDVRFEQAHLDQLLPRYAAPFLAGGRWQDLEGAGVIDASASLQQNQPQTLIIELADIGLKAGSPALQADGLSGKLAWQRSNDSPVSTITWRGLQYGDLPVGASTISARAQGRDFQLLPSPRLPILGGAVVVDALELHNIGEANLFARFAATIEPIDLAALCKALGWPPFGGEISGRIPGVSIHDNELAFDGRLSVKAFDGEISIEDLRMPEVFGRLPRVLANLRLRNLDLKAMTQAFSFGRIEGRLSGDVNQLRLLSWLPVAFDARIYTPDDDRSQHRISQRAIDNLSSLGGGPTGLLQRGVLRFFEDFAYDRIGWSCRLENDVCVMDGVEPAKNGGYVLVKGRLLPRIDVIGYERRVDWDRFVAQLLAIRGTEGVQVR